ncbi:RHS repeat-associated core domain-containing protein [Chengkuizengella axinellae]|uniref:RHS repeat-associated core domain-containing protein n=1 Tax=Chengkuizengella axinellae TaxID=3064388 RepID=A0ABT9J0I7_9BACL|nr:RHS repeat-associated core domain-containing protein [Chengkuizengella sp. 2205SS18-9]MDP5275123.1 RHS repeat-associated core domain-containing protein [Chengkuizengella sp. 2205SS18-9]
MKKTLHKSLLLVFILIFLSSTIIPTYASQITNSFISFESETPTMEEEPVTEEPLPEETPVAEPVTEGPLPEETPVAEPVTEEPLPEETPVTEEPVIEEPLPEETPVTEEPVTEEPLPEETPVTEEPVIEETISEGTVNSLEALSAKEQLIIGTLAVASGLEFTDQEVLGAVTQDMYNKRKELLDEAIATSTDTSVTVTRELWNWLTEYAQNDAVSLEGSSLQYVSYEHVLNGDWNSPYAYLSASTVLEVEHSRMRVLYNNVIETKTLDGHYNPGGWFFSMKIQPVLVHGFQGSGLSWDIFDYNHHPIISLLYQGNLVATYDMGVKGNDVKISSGYIPLTTPAMVDTILLTAKGTGNELWYWNELELYTQSLTESVLKEVLISSDDMVLNWSWTQGANLEDVSIILPVSATTISTTTDATSNLINMTAGNFIYTDVRSTPISGSDAATKIQSIDYYSFADTRSFHADPVDTSSGAMVIHRNLLQLHGPQKLAFKTAYNSLLLNDNSLGIGWSHNFDTYLEQESENSVVIHWSNHQKNRFILNVDGTYDSIDRATRWDQLTQNEDGSYTIKRKDQKIYQFDSTGKLMELINRHGKSTFFEYDASTNQLIKVIEEDTGFYFEFAYSLNNQLTQLTDNLNRVVLFQYDANNHLTQITNARGEIITYTYDEQGRVISSTEQGVQIFLNTYDELGRVIAQDDGVEGNGITTFQYDEESEPGFLITLVTKRDGQIKKLIHDYQYRLVRIEDELGHVTTMEYDGLGNLIKETKSLNQTEQYVYDERGNKIEIIDPLGNSTTMTYDDRNNLIRFTDAIHQTTENRYDEYNRLVQVTNPEGNTLTNTYNDLGYVHSMVNFNGDETLFTSVNGMLQEKTDPNGNIVKYEYDEIGRLMKETFSETEVVTYTYDALDNVTQKTDQLGYSTQFAYDMQGNLLQETNVLGESTNYSYNANGKLISVQDRAGNSIFYEYDAEDRLQKIIDPLGNETIQTYDAKGRVIQITDPAGNVTTKEYSAIDQLLIETDPLGYSKFFTYDPLGYVSSTTDRDGNTTFTTYNATGQLTQVTDALSGTTQYVYDSKGNIIKEVDALGNETHYTYDGTGNLLSKTDALGNSTSYVYDSNGNLVIETDAANQSTRYAYNHVNQLITTTDAKENTLERVYDAKGRMISTIDPLGNTVSMNYDELDRLVSSTDEVGNIETYTYDSMDRLLSTTDSEGNKSTFTYDVLGNLLSETNALNLATQYTYDKNRNRLTETDAKGNTTSYTYNQRDELIQKEDALGNVILYVYNKEGRLTHITDALENTTTYTYDANGRQTGVTDALGNTLTTQYDAVGNVISELDAKGTDITSVLYNDGYLPIQTIDALGNSTSQAYDAIGRLTTLTDPSGNIQTYQYDAVNQLIQSINAMGGVSQQSFDSKGQVVSFTDANGVQTSFQYDVAGRLIQETLDSGGILSYQYDGRDLLTQKKNARDQVTTFEYDAIGRLIKTVSPESPIDITYDENNNRLTVTDQDGKAITRVYDVLDRIVSYTDEYGNKIEYQYDEIGNISQLTYPDGKIVSYTYDEAGNMKSVTDWTGRVTSYTYDENNKLISTLRSDASIETRTYDVAGQLIELKDETANGDIIHYETFTYDASNNVVSEGEKNYVYDDLDRLTNAENILQPLDQSIINYQYAYDIGGNIQSIQKSTDLSTQETNMTYTSDNRLETYNGEAVLYDADGNMTYGPVNGVMEQMKYDAQNRLIRAGDFTYTYNAEDIRTSVTNTITNEKTYQVVNPHAYYSQLLMEVDAEGNPITYYVYGLGLIAQETANGDYSAYHYDRRGSTVALTNENGEITDQYTYSPYGELLYSEGAADHPFLYNGKYGVVTDDNGLYYMRARYYNPDIKRFINRDVVQGSISSSLSLNKYAYVNGNPVSYIDPFGLSRDSDDVGFLGKTWGFTKSAANFLVFDDARTVLDSDASFTERVVAGASLLPAGKVFKLGKLVGNAKTGVKASKESKDFSKLSMIDNNGAGKTGAYNPSFNGISGQGLGRLEGKELNVSQKGLDIVKSHLSQFGDFPENTAMIRRLEDATANKKKISGADASFYMHEVSESTKMKKGIDYDTAHKEALQKYEVSPFSVYHPDVIKSMPENFGGAWKKFWGID